jgi:hypothetical protein
VTPIKDRTDQEVKNSRRNKIILGFLSAMATFCSLCIATVALVPGFWNLISSNSVAEVINNATSSPIDVEYLYKYVEAGNYRHPILEETKLEYIELGDIEYISYPFGNHVIFSVTNTSDHEIILSKELPLKIVEFRPFSEEVSVLLVGGGGGAAYRNFVVDIPANNDTAYVKAVFDESLGTNQTIDDVRDESVIDYFKLVPEEVEAFRIEIRYEGPGIFTFEPGVEYFEDGESVNIWLGETITAVVPENISVWEKASSSDGANDEGLLKKGNCVYAYPRTAGNLFRKIYDCDYE